MRLSLSGPGVCKRCALVAYVQQQQGARKAKEPKDSRSLVQSAGESSADQLRSRGEMPRIDSSRRLLVERATLRRADKRTGQISHHKYNAPPADAGLVHPSDALVATVKRHLADGDRVGRLQQPRLH